ncbi:MAG TPA: hypothetical protein VEK15_02280, partial [Vicinamibacteria bacterium]|nr:hypothetical protein [Vicinamibacteria bacterium]
MPTEHIIQQMELRLSEHPEAFRVSTAQAAMTVASAVWICAVDVHPLALPRSPRFNSVQTKLNRSAHRAK